MRRGKLSLLVIIMSSLFSFSLVASEVIPFNVKGFWYRGRIAESKIAYIDDVNALIETNYRMEDIQADIEINGCTSPFVQLSVKAMLRTFGASRKIKITKIESRNFLMGDFSHAPCTYQARGGRGLCYGDICVSPVSNQFSPRKKAQW